METSLETPAMLNGAVPDASALFEAGKIERKLVTVGKLRIHIRALSSSEMKQITQRVAKETRGKTDIPVTSTSFYEWLVIYGAMKPDGTTQMFGEEHLQKLKAMRSGVINALALEIMALSGAGDPAIQEEVETLDADPLAGAASSPS